MNNYLGLQVLIYMNDNFSLQVVTYMNDDFSLQVLTYMNDNFGCPGWHPVVEMLRYIHLIHLTSISADKPIEVKTLPVTATKQVKKL